MKAVVTYRLAYTDHRITLCAGCIDEPDIPPLGPVTHGARPGKCDWCPTCEECGEDIPRRDIAAYRSAGSGLPRICEDCAEAP